MRNLVPAILAVTLVAAICFSVWVLATSPYTSDADAQGTWQYTFYDRHEDFAAYLETLPADCAIDWETHDNSLGTLYSIAYSCPD